MTSEERQQLKRLIDRATRERVGEMDGIREAKRKLDAEYRRRRYQSRRAA